MKQDVITISCPPLEVDRPKYVHNRLDTWVQSEPLQCLVKQFGGDIRFGGKISSVVNSLLTFSDIWDYRGQLLQQQKDSKTTSEGMRWLLEDSSPFMPEQLDAIIECSTKLDLILPQQPEYKTYDFVLVLGGARLSCLLRTQLAADLIKKQIIKPAPVILLGSGRPIADSERDATDTYAPNAIDEFGLMNAAAVKAFGVNEIEYSEERYDDENPNKSWVVRHYESRDGDQEVPIISLCAPSSEPDIRRANSADTYDFFIEQLHMKEDSRLLLLTSQIYVPYQQLEAIRRLALPRHIVIDTIGFPPDWGGDLQGMRSPKNYLQEIRSVIQASKRFLDDYPDS